MKIVDTFTFYNELDILMLRLSELYDTVDHFVICEATYTHAGHPKPLFYQENKDRFMAFQDKIIHVVVNDMPNTRNAWDNERFQRNAISRGIDQLHLNDEDLIMISDCDEIPDPDTLREIDVKEIAALNMDLYYYNIESYIGDWGASKIMRFRVYKTNPNPDSFRRRREQTIIPNGGWHLSYFGDVSFIQNKLQNFAHQEFNNQHIFDKIEQCIRTKTNLFSNTMLKHIPFETNEYLPKHYLLQNRIHEDQRQQLTFFLAGNSDRHSSEQKD